VKCPEYCQLIGIRLSLLFQKTHLLITKSAGGFYKFFK
jgi:hypothetical protein